MLSKKIKYNLMYSKILQNITQIKIKYGHEKT